MKFAGAIIFKWLCCLLMVFSAMSFANYNANKGTAEPIALYLTWQRSPESTMTIFWITGFDNHDDRMEYRREGDGRWIAATGTHTLLPSEHSPHLLHSIELINLQADTEYLFRIGRYANKYKFRTAPATLTESIHFVVGGDIYHDSIESFRETNRVAAKTNPLFAIVGGDIAYADDKAASFIPNWAQSFFNPLTNQKIDRWLIWLTAWKNDMVAPDGRLIPLLPVIGNHDTNGRFDQTPAQAPFFYSLFAMPGQQGYNVLDFGDYLSIILLDSGHTHSVGGPQTVWLENALRQRNHIWNKMAVYHVPAFPSVRPFNYDVSMQIRKNWVPLFEKYHLTMAFEHHDHAYKRTFPLRDGQIDLSGVVYMGDGAWGVHDPRKPDTQRWYIANSASSRHFISAAIHPDRREITAISFDGKVLDEFSW